MTYVGVGWIIWRDKAHLPEDLVFELHYLGSTEFTFSLTFSRGAAPIVAQYFNLLHLGFQGYRKVALDNFKNARSLSRALEKSGYFVVLSDIHRAKGTRNGHGIDSPNFEVCCGQCSRIFSQTACRITRQDFQSSPSSFRMSSKSVFLICNKSGYRLSCAHGAGESIYMKTNTSLIFGGRLIPNYNLCPDCQDIEILRVVVKENMTEMVRLILSVTFSLFTYLLARPTLY